MRKEEWCRGERGGRNGEVVREEWGELRVKEDGGMISVEGYIRKRSRI